MEIQNIQGLSRKSRGIIYRLKHQLNQSRITLKQHICNIFGFYKEQFRKKQFFLVIQKFDQQLVFSELDQLFDQLDQGRNQKVFLYHIQQVYENINEKDNPQLVDKNRMISTVSKISKGKVPQVVQIIQQLRKIFLKSEDLIEIMYLLASESEGYLTIDIFNNVLNNLDYNNHNSRNILLQILFQEKQSIKLQTFLQKLDLNQSARRSIVGQLPLALSQSFREKVPEDLNKSAFIIQHLKDNSQQLIQLSVSKNMSMNRNPSSNGNEYIQLQNIPQILRPFFNYGSQLEASFALISSQYIEGKAIFIDTQNPPYSLAYQWIHLAQNHRNYFLFQMAKSVLVRQKARTGLGQLLQPKDIIQGSLGDCYFLSAVAGVVQKYPELIYRLFVLQKNPSHVYGVRLFIEGMWRTIILDACFPVNRHGVFCGAQPHHQQIWVMLLQKAWAKVYGSYDNIHSGYNQQGLNAVSGAPSLSVSAKQTDFVRRVEVELKRGSIITCATSAYTSQLTKDQQSKLGIFANHAYSLLNVYSKVFIGNQQITLMKVRNPWGRKAWEGRWSYKSHLWTPELRKALDFINDPLDGTFFVCQEDFCLYFDHVNICRINLAYKNSWIQVQTDRQQFKAIRLKVKQKGDYYFTLYQQNPRRHSGRNYQKSKSWLFLCNQKDGHVQAIGSSCKDKRDNSIQVSLEKGVYILIAKIQWKFWQKHHYIVSSYGPQRVSFSIFPKFNIHVLSDFIQSKAKLGFGKKSFYDNANIVKRVLFSPDQGYGFILINNQENKIFELQIKFDQYRGLTILPPYSLPIQLQIFPGEEVICKFLVDPTGYSYSLKESYKFRKAI